MSSPDFYAAGLVKRHRSTKAEVEHRREALFDLVATMVPMTVRQVFYQATVHGLVEKSDDGYDRIQRDLVLMRRAGTLPYNWLTDNTRWQRRPRTFGSVGEALAETARLYRKRLWDEQDCYVEIWLEKDALAGVVWPVTNEFDVPLMVARGYASLSFLHTAAEYINTLNVPAFIYHFGDYDPSGVNAGDKIEQTLREMAPAAEIHFERIAVTPKLITEWNLPTRPIKTTDSRARGFGAVSVELDAIHPEMLRGLVAGAIEQHLPARQHEVLKAAEKSEQTLIRQLVSGIGGTA